MYVYLGVAGGLWGLMHGGAVAVAAAVLGALRLGAAAGASVAWASRRQVRALTVRRAVGVMAGLPRRGGALVGRAAGSGHPFRRRWCCFLMRD